MRRICLLLAVWGMGMIVPVAWAQDNVLPAVPSGTRFDMVVTPDMIQSISGGDYATLLETLIPRNEAERRAMLMFRRWLDRGVNVEQVLEGVEEDAIESTLGTELGESLSSLEREDGLFSPYPNNINALFWRVLPFDASRVAEDRYNFRVRMMPGEYALSVWDPDLDLTSIFPLKEEVRADDPVSGETAISIPMFSEGFRRMMRWHEQAPGCVGPFESPCVENPYTGLLADAHPTMTNNGDDVKPWFDVVTQCSARGGRLPRAEEAWFFTTTGRWSQNEGVLISRAQQSISSRREYYILTGDVLDMSDGRRGSLPAVKVLGIRVPIENGIPNYQVTYDRMVYLQYKQGDDHPTTVADRTRYGYHSVFYCVYD